MSAHAVRILGRQFSIHVGEQLLFPGVSRWKSHRSTSLKARDGAPQKFTHGRDADSQRFADLRVPQPFQPQEKAPALLLG
jgi:hypothetical protein